MRNEEALGRSQSSQDELLAVARALKKQFAGNRKDSSDPAQTTAGEEAGPIILKATEIFGGTQSGRQKRKGVWHSVAKAYPEYAHLPTDSQRLIRYSLRAARCTRSDTRQLLGRGGQTGPNAEHSRPVYRWSVSRRPPLTGVLGSFLCSSR